MTLSVVIVNWNVRDRLRACLASLESALEGLDFQVIVVDNASEDGSPQMVETEFAWVSLIRNSRNEGFARANNQAFEQVTGEWVLLLNPDTLITKGAVQRMIATLQRRDEVAVIGPRIVDENGEPVRACKRPAPSLWTIFKGLFLIDQLVLKLTAILAPKLAERRSQMWFGRSEPVPCIQGSCMLVRRTALDALGGFDETVPMYLDDNDLCKRVADQGQLVYYEADATIIHYGAQSVSRLRNARLSSLVGCLANDAYFIKHGTWGDVILYHIMLGLSSIIFLVADLILLPVFLLIGKPQFVINYWLKHWGTLAYALVGRFWTRHLPSHWPRSIWWT